MIAAGEVRLHVEALDESVTSYRDHWAILSPEERAAAETYRLPRDRRLRVAARAFLRTLLGRCLGLPPEQVPLQRSTSGKPILADPSDLRFNLSHSAGYGACVVARGLDLGVDLEGHRDFKDPEALARRVLCRDEAHWFAHLPGAERNGWLLRCWTVKEAYLKATGEGISRPLREVETEWSEPGPCLRAIGGDPLEASRWTAWLPSLGSDLYCTVVAQRPHQTFRWSRGADLTAAQAPQL